MAFFIPLKPGDLHRVALQRRAALEWLGQNNVRRLAKSREVADFSVIERAQEGAKCVVERIHAMRWAADVRILRD
ncbi:MAG TPA: hypothetical protein VGJ20_28380 [Xanthobacteraceae bacterium]